ncbi:MAG: hypothetical protein M3463_04465, partial [Verrucomicrobiota bacterium]|nr:hypothetical protein [Verrucomicrobiota bacterium]
MPGAAGDVSRREAAFPAWPTELPAQTQARRKIVPSYTDQYGMVAPVKDPESYAPGTKSYEEDQIPGVEPTKSQAKTPKPKTYEEAQSRIDEIEDRLERKGQDVNKLFDPAEPKNEAFSEAGAKKMPDDLVEAYANRDEIGSSQLSESISQISTGLKATG